MFQRMRMFQRITGGARAGCRTLHQLRPFPTSGPDAVPARVSRTRVLHGLVVTAALAAAVPAGAAPRDAVANVSAWMREAVGDMALDNCIDPAASRPFSSTFYGAVRTDPHLSASERNALDAVLLEGIDSSRLSLNVSSASGSGTLAPIVSRESFDVGAFSEALSRIGNSVLPVVTTVTRPAPNVVQVRLTASARGEGGVYGCNRQHTLAISLDDFSVVPQPRGARDYLTPEGADRAALDALAPLLRDREAIALDVSGPACPLIARARERFEDAWFARADRQLGTPDAPALPRLLDGSADAATRVELRYSLPEAETRVLEASVVLIEEGARATRRRIAQVVPEADVAECRAAIEAASSDTIAEREAREAAERERLVAERVEAELAARRAEEERLAAERAERERIEAERAEAAAMRAELEQLRAEREARETAEREAREEAEREAREAAERERIAEERRLAEEKAARELGVVTAITLDPDRVATGEEFDLVIETERCSPFVFDYAERDVTPIPIEAFDRREGAGDALVFALDAASGKALRVEAGDAPGRHYLGALCVGEGGRPSPEMLREFVGLLESGPATGFLEDGTPYAFGSYVKAD